jgi:hypothetical protein
MNEICVYTVDFFTKALEEKNLNSWLTSMYYQLHVLKRIPSLSIICCSIIHQNLPKVNCVDFTVLTPIKIVNNSSKIYPIWGNFKKCEPKTRSFSFTHLLSQSTLSKIHLSKTFIHDWFKGLSFEIFSGKALPFFMEDLLSPPFKNVGRN